MNRSNRSRRCRSLRAAALARAFPAFAALTADQLLELIEETNIARALAAREEWDAADACFTAVADRLGIASEVDAFTAAALRGENGESS